MAWRTHRSHEHRSTVASRRYTPDSVVVVGFDRSRASEHALAYASGVAQRLRGQLLIVNVTRTPPTAHVLALLSSCAIAPTIATGCQHEVDGSVVVDENRAVSLMRRIEEVLGHDSAPWALECRRGHTAKTVSTILAGTTTRSFRTVQRQHVPRCVQCSWTTCSALDLVAHTKCASSLRAPAVFSAFVLSRCWSAPAIRWRA